MGELPPFKMAEERRTGVPEVTVVVPLIVIAGVTDDVIVIVIPVAVAVVGFAQAMDEVITTVTTSPFINALFE